MTEHLISAKYKALFKDTFRAVLDATLNERLAERTAMEHVLSAAMLSVAEARREIVVVDSIRDQFSVPLTVNLH